LDHLFWLRKERIETAKRTTRSVQLSSSAINQLNYWKIQLIYCRRWELYRSCCSLCCFNAFFP
jgi:hypothetical protein